MCKWEGLKVMEIFDCFSVVLTALYAAWTIALINVAIKSAWKNIGRISHDK